MYSERIENILPKLDEMGGRVGYTRESSGDSVPAQETEPGYGTRDTGYGIRRTGHGIRDSGHGRDGASWESGNPIPRVGSTTSKRHSCSRALFLRAPYPVSRIPYPEGSSDAHS